MIASFPRRGDPNPGFVESLQQGAREHLQSRDKGRLNSVASPAPALLLSNAEAEAEVDM
jgi:hypothetical protein